MADPQMLPRRLSRRRFFATSAGVWAASIAATGARGRARFAANRPVPTRPQLEWQRDELALFLHFGVNTFTDREWGDGKEDPAIFAPANLDARQWTATAKAAGAKAAILTAKHHDGFCLWPTRTTTHSVAHSPFRGGGGDVVREFVDACRAEGLKPGLYLSPWDRNAAVYGDSPRYNDFYCDQLTELLTHYGAIHEVWFDGANGEGPNGKKQQYDWPRVWGLVRKLQPKAIMFSDAGPDVRWIGNEAGQAGDPNWSTVVPGVVPVPGTSGRAATDMMLHGDPSGAVWRPGETDVSIRPGWFHHPAEDARVRTVDNLVNLYFTSVGRNSKLLLNVPPTKDGLIHEVDAARLKGMRERLSAMFSNDLAKGRKAVWRSTGEKTATLEVGLGRAEAVAVIDLAEDIEHGQTISKFVVEGADADTWAPLVRGTTIGHRRLLKVAATTPVRRVRVTIEDAVAKPRQPRLSVW